MPRYQDHTFASRQRRSTGSKYACGKSHGNQHIPTPPTPPLGNPLATQTADPDPGGSSSSHNSRPLSAQGVHDQSEPNAAAQEPASNSADSQVPKSQPSTTDQTLTESGVMSNGDNPDPMIQINPLSDPEPQLAPDVAGTPTIAGPPPPYPEPHGGHAPRPWERRQRNVPPAQTGLSQWDYFLSPGAIVWRPLQHPDERSQLSTPHGVIWKSGHSPRYTPSA